LESSTDPSMKLPSLLKAWAAIVLRHKPRSGRNKRRPLRPTFSPESLIQSPPHRQTDTGEGDAKIQQLAEERLVLAAPTSPSVAPPRPPTAPPPPPQKADPLPRPTDPTIHLLPSIPSSPPPSPHYSKQERHENEESTSSCSSETAASTDADSGPGNGTERPVHIVANLPGSPIREVEPSEPRLASATEEQPENAAEIDTDATTNPESSRCGDDQPGSHAPLVDSPALTLPASFISPETTEEDPDFELAGSMYPSVVPMMPPLIGEDRDALEEYLAKADDDQDHTMSLATLPHDGTSDSAPLGLAQDEEGHLNGQAKMGILWDHLFASSDSLNHIKRKRSKQPLHHSCTHLAPISENPLYLSTDMSVTDDKDGTKNKILVFTFCKRTAARSQTVDEVLDDFKTFLHQHPDVQRLQLTFEADIRFPADFIAHAVARVQKSLTRLTHVELRFESTAVQSQAIWTWPPGSQLRFLRLEGIARGARLPLTQLQELTMDAELKSFEAASFLASLPQLRTLSLCIGRVRSEKTLFGPIVLPQLERLELHAKVNPAAFFSRLHLPALRSLGLILDIESDGDFIDYGKTLCSCKIPWSALNEVLLSGPSAGRETLLFLHQLFRGDGPEVETQCLLSREC
ncbi:hypothetical protein EV715DRAFT_208963, partial [Schizophyllum commune]